MEEQLLCKDCQKLLDNPINSHCKCLDDRAVDPVKGIVHRSAHTVRSYEHLCGKDAKWFKAK